MTSLGAYVGNNPSAILEFEQWLGRPVDQIHATLNKGSWSEFVSSASWEVNLWKPIDKPIFWSVPMITDGASLAVAATGAYDSYYLQVANALANAKPDQDVIYVRIGEEFNGNWMPWAAAGHEQEFIETFRQMVDTFRSVSDKFRFEWNVNVGDYGMDPAKAYPGDHYVDVVGMDFYYSTKYYSQDPAAAWNSMVNQKYGLQWLEDFASAHGKPTAYSEWAVNADNAGVYIEKASQWFASHDVLYQHYWNVDSSFDGKLNSGDHAGTAAAYQSAFSETSATSPPPPVVGSFSPDSNVVGDGITGADHVTLAGTATAGSTVKIFDGATQVGTATVNSAGTWSFATATLGDGVHSFTAKTVNAAGDLSAASTALKVTVDTVAPTVPVLASFSPDSNMVGDGITNANKVNLAGTAVAGSVIKIFDGVTEVGTATANSAGAWSFTAATLSEGVHSFTAKAVDAAGNQSAASAALKVTVDTVAPTAPVVASFSPDSNVVGDGITNANQVTLAGTAAAGSLVKIFDGSTQVGTATANSAGTWNFATATLSDGVHYLTAKAMDAAGNQSATSAPLKITVDTVTPTVPVVASFSPDSNVVGDGITNSNKVNLAGTAAAGSIVKIFDGSTQVGTATANSAGTWNFAATALSEGVHSFTAKAADAAGNQSAASAALKVTVDTVTPTAPVVASFSPDSNVVDDGITNVNHVNLAGTAVAGSVVKIFDGSTQVGTATANSAGTWSFSTATLSEGVHYLTARAMDVAGNQSAASAALKLTVDTVTPGVPVVASFSPDGNIVGDGITNANKVNLAGTAAAGSLVKIFDGSTQVGTAIANSAGTWSFATATLSEGAHSFTVKAMDTAGNQSAASAALKVTVDTVAPTAPVLASFSPDSNEVGDGITNANHVTLTGTAVAGSVVKIFDGSTQVGTATASASGVWNFATATLSEGAHSFIAKDMDAAGNLSAASATLNVTVDTVAPAAPVLKSFSPDSNVVGDGITSANHVTLAGTAVAGSVVKIFDGATQVGTVTASTTGVWNFATATLSDGTHSFTAKDMDAAGNLSSASAALKVTVDTSGLPAHVDPNNLAGTATLIYSNEFNSLKFWDGTSGLDTRPAFAMPSWADHGFAWTAASDTWYVQPSDPGSAAINPFSIDNGVLTITAERSDNIYSDVKGSYEYTSGVITTYHEFAQTYGYFEMRAQTSNSPGTLPAFWLLPADGSWPPELDVMEIVGSNQTTLFTSAHSQLGGAVKIDDTHYMTNTYTAIANASASFHTYGMDWEADKITWYFDGVQVFQIDTPADMHKPMYLIANLNVGGDWEGHPDASLAFSAEFKIDYIRAYSAMHNDATPVITSSGGASTASILIAENTNAVVRVVATDADGTSPTYSIAGGADAALFAINATTGQLTFVSAPDFEAPRDAGMNNVYDVVVRATDGVHNTDQAIAVKVVDADDTAPVITSNGGSATAAISIAENTRDVTIVHATDIDSSNIIYSVAGGADAALFQIDSKTGMLAFVNAPDYEAPRDAGGNNVYDVTVQASDGAHTTKQSISVSVHDVDDSVSAAAFKAAVLQSANPIIFQETNQHYNASWRLTATEKLTEVIHYDDGKLVDETYNAAGVLKSASVTQTVEGKEVTEFYDSHWKFTGAEVTTLGNKTITEVYDSAWKFVSADVFSMQNGKAVEEHYDANWKFVSADVGSQVNGKAVLEHFDLHWAAVSSDVFIVGSTNTVTEHYNANWKLVSADVASQSLKNDIAHQPMMEWLLA